MRDMVNDSRHPDHLRARGFSLPFLLIVGLALIAVGGLLAYQAIAQAGAFVAMHPYLYLGLAPGSIGLGLVGLSAVQWASGGGRRD